MRRSRSCRVSSACRTRLIGYELMFDTGGSGGTMAAASFDALVAGLSRAIDGLLAVDPDCVSDGELAEAMLSLRREQARLAAVVADQTAAFEARQGYAEDGSRSATD